MNKMEEIQERINLLEAEIETLKQPQLMYRRPNSTEYEKVTDFLDYVANRLAKIEEYLDDDDDRLIKLEEQCAVIFANFDVRLKKVEEQSNYVMNWRMSDEYKEAGKKP